MKAEAMLNFLKVTLFCYYSSVFSDHFKHVFSLIGLTGAEIWPVKGLLNRFYGSDYQDFLNGVIYKSDVGGKLYFLLSLLKDTDAKVEERFLYNSNNFSKISNISNYFKYPKYFFYCKHSIEWHLKEIKEMKDIFLRNIIVIFGKLK
jgi:hypothetical protein